MKKSIRFSFASLLLLLFALPVFGAPMSSSDAARAVDGWLSVESSPFETGGRSFVRVECYDEDGKTASDTGAVYYAAYLNPRGIVLMPADDLLEPIAAFLPDAGEYEHDPAGPLYKLVVSNIIEQMRLARAEYRGANGGAQGKWAMLAGVSTGGIRGDALPGIDTIQEVVVEPLLKTEWSQETVVSSDFYVYNYYTPNHYPSGCTATAASQIMRFFEYPKQGIGAKSREIAVDGVETTAVTRGGDGAGGPYKWDLMPYEPSTLGASLSLEQRESIGALLYDAGISIKSIYGPGSEGGTASFIFYAAEALVNTFGYSNAVGASYSTKDEKSGLPLDVFRNAVNSNLDAGLPVGIGATGPSGGHAFAADGYGYNLDTMYHHMNLGWSGFDNLWYNVPTVSGDSADFIVLDEIAYNIYTEGSGEIASGRVRNDDGTPAAGAAVTIEGGDYSATTTADSTGRFAFAKIPSNTTFLVSVPSGDTFSGASRQIRTGKSVSYFYDTTSPTTGNLWGVELKEGEFHKESSSGGSSGCSTGAGVLIGIFALALMTKAKRKA